MPTRLAVALKDRRRKRFSDRLGSRNTIWKHQFTTALIDPKANQATLSSGYWWRRLFIFDTSMAFL
jgi:hypothetical protein